MRKACAREAVAMAAGSVEARAGGEAQPGGEGRGGHGTAALRLDIEEPQPRALAAADQEPVAVHGQLARRERAAGLGSGAQDLQRLAAPRREGARPRMEAA